MVPCFAITPPLKFRSPGPRPLRTPRCSGLAPQAPKPSDPPITVRDLSFSWSPSRPILHNLNFSVAPGELTMLVGPNGSGKTTLLHLLRGLLLPDAGNVSITRPVSYVQQNPELQIIMPTIGHDISLSVPLGATRPKADVISEIHAVLEDVGLVPTDRFISMSSHRISGGQRQRAVVAAALVRTPAVILFDEPTASLDPQSKAELVLLVRRLVSERNIAALW